MVGGWIADDSRWRWRFSAVTAQFPPIPMTQTTGKGGAPAPELPDALAAELAAGETSALGALFEIHRPAFRRLVHFRIDPRVAQRVDPDDVLQEAYLQAEKRIDTFVGEDGLSAFV